MALGSWWPNPASIAMKSLSCLTDYMPSNDRIPTDKIQGSWTRLKQVIGTFDTTLIHLDACFVHCFQMGF